MMKRNLTLSTFLFALLLGGCAAVLPIPEKGFPAVTPTSQPVCPPCAEPEKPKAAAKSLQSTEWQELPGWDADDHAVVLDLFRQQCANLAKRPLWLATCEAAQKVGDGGTARAWFEAQFRPWMLVNPDEKREGMVTGYYEPIVRGSRSRQASYTVPVFGPPEDMIVVDLGELYPELKHMRLRGKLDGRKLVPYFSRAEWSAEEKRRSQQALLWLDDPVDFFFLQIQGSGQVVLDDGSRVRIGYADQNGHPYKSIGKWLIDQGELKSHEASMQGIKAWAAVNPRRLQELLNANPSLVFFRELLVTGDGPPGALGIPLTPERSIAVDPRHTPLGAPVWLSTTRPNSDEALQRLMLAQDTGGAIRGPVRADFYWGSGAAAGAQAGKMKQSGRMWVLLPRWHTP